jgi:hypothetical protein
MVHGLFSIVSIVIVVTDITIGMTVVSTGFDEVE